MMPNGDRMVMDKMNGVIVIWHHSHTFVVCYRRMEQKHNTYLVT